VGLKDESEAGLPGAVLRSVLHDAPAPAGSRRGPGAHAPGAPAAGALGPAPQAD
jgi:hypothetical protein